MIFFRVSNNVNIKITDGSLVVYKKIKQASLLDNEEIYCTTYEDFLDIEKVFARIDESYKARILDENKVRQIDSFPIELGLSNQNEFKRIKAFEIATQKAHFLNETLKNESCSLFLQTQQKAILHTQLTKEATEISVAIIGGVGRDIGEMVASIPALRILYEELKTVYNEVKIDIYLNASSNSYYSRDKEILSELAFIHSIQPLSLSFKTFCSYDYYIDNSLISHQCFYDELPYVDAYLHKFGLDYQNIKQYRKHNEISLKNYAIKMELNEKLLSLKKQHKLLLFHPFSAHNKRSIPIELSKKILKKVLLRAEDYMVVTLLDVEGVKANNYVNLTKYSKSFRDFAYIISQMDRILTVDTATYHIAEAFFIPTLVMFSNDKMEQRLAYYEHVKGIEVKDKTKPLSKFIFENEKLNLYHFDNWQSLKVGKVMKLLEKIG
ncbi:glycosyltransferase family 9 protein [Candidatus Marinarcus aquaticus]|uniref:Lipopolysaccharide heptosyltransferase family protein n=1 Tax=Candidatus Marinarcus aquaticus TaxID=2044504 RepID=A0A4Q0XNH7_9BACT|nr:hypothetical protein [Candidatus Marinarcus aquaticus]RXJ56231.1 hypothetical protein CRV04_09300 [Candidatus Marinarcus aquaticus]